MRSTALTMCLLLALWAAGNFPSEAAAQSLLNGDTASNYTIPAGWTAVAVQGFESGTIPTAKQAIGSYPITTAKAHTGTQSVGGTISGDGQSVYWALLQDNHSSREVYLSYWEYMSADGRFNDEMFSALFKRVISTSPSNYQHVYWDWFWQAANCGRPEGMFNSPSGQLHLFSEGVGAGELHKTYWETNYAPCTAPQIGQWAQFEVHFKANTPGLTDGFFRAYVNGAQVGTPVTNVNLNGGIEMRGMRVQAGGTYTKHIWYIPPDPPLTCSAFIGQGTTDNAHRCSNFSNCLCHSPVEQNVQPFERYLDDIIVMVPTGSGGSTDTSAPKAPSGLSVR